MAKRKEPHRRPSKDEMNERLAVPVEPERRAEIIEGFLKVKPEEPDQPEDLDRGSR